MLFTTSPTATVPSSSAQTPTSSQPGGNGSALPATSIVGIVLGVVIVAIPLAPCFGIHMWAYKQVRERLGLPVHTPERWGPSRLRLRIQHLRAEGPARPQATPNRSSLRAPGPSNPNRASNQRVRFVLDDQPGSVAFPGNDSPQQQQRPPTRANRHWAPPQLGRVLVLEAFVRDSEGMLADMPDRRQTRSAPL